MYSNLSALCERYGLHLQTKQTTYRVQSKTVHKATLSIHLPYNREWNISMHTVTAPAADKAKDLAAAYILSEQDTPRLS